MTARSTAMRRNLFIFWNWMVGLKGSRLRWKEKEKKKKKSAIFCGEFCDLYSTCANPFRAINGRGERFEWGDPIGHRLLCVSFSSFRFGFRKKSTLDTGNRQGNLHMTRSSAYRSVWSSSLCVLSHGLEMMSLLDQICEYVDFELYTWGERSNKWS